jgi:hypothetical protein
LFNAKRMVESLNTWQAENIGGRRRRRRRLCGADGGERWRAMESQVLLCEGRDRVYLEVEAAYK